ncbi:MAG: nuclear transport factor 2 family protein [Chakrabartia sp.]
MTPIDALVAEHEISKAIIDYARLNDAGQWAALAALYTDDGRMSRPTAPDDFVEGREAILASFTARPPRAARHICANILVTLDGPEAARATSQILLFVGEAGEAGGLPQQSALPPMVGTYQDRLVKTAQGWRFVERRGSLDFKPATR